MLINQVANIITTLANIFIFFVIIDSLLSYFLQPSNPVRYGLDRVVSPFLTPIRRIVPPLGMFDLSPIILLILVEIVSTILVHIL